MSYFPNPFTVASTQESLPTQYGSIYGESDVYRNQDTPMGEPSRNVALIQEDYHKSVETYFPHNKNGCKTLCKVMKECSLSCTKANVYSFYSLPSQMTHVQVFPDPAQLFYRCRQELWWFRMRPEPVYCYGVKVPETVAAQVDMGVTMYTGLQKTVVLLFEPSRNVRVAGARSS